MRTITHTHLSRLPLIEIEVPTYELPLPEGVGEEKFQQDHLSMREIEDSWKERLHERHSQQQNN